MNFTPREKSAKSLTLFTKLELKINSHSGALKILKRRKHSPVSIFLVGSREPHLLRDVHNDSDKAFCVKLRMFSTATME